MRAEDSGTRYYRCICSPKWPNRTDCAEHGTPDPWPFDWEQRPEKDLCTHEWHIHVTPNGSGARVAAQKLTDVGAARGVALPAPQHRLRLAT